MNVEDARARIIAAGLTVGNEVRVDSTSPKDVVTEQNPKGGNQVAWGTAVNLTVSTGNLPPPPSAEINLPVTFPEYSKNMTFKVSAYVNGERKFISDLIDVDSLPNREYKGVNFSTTATDLKVIIKVSLPNGPEKNWYEYDIKTANGAVISTDRKQLAQAEDVLKPVTPSSSSSSSLPSSSSPASSAP